MRLGSFALVFVLAFSAGALHGCGGGSAKPTPTCVLASDCTGDLVCALGFCVSACKVSKDCPSGQLCVQADTGMACRAPEVAKGCAQNSDCTDHCAKDDAGTGVCPIVCGRDFSCRTQCVQDVDCPGGGRAGGQKCTVSGACVDPVLEAAIYDPKTNEFKASASTGIAGSSGHAGTGGGAGTTGAAGTTGDAGTGGGDAGTTGAAGTTGGAGTTGAAGNNPDGGAGTTGAAGSDAGMGNPDAALMADSTVVKPDKQLRQGQGLGITITITKAVGGLSNPTAPDLGDLKVSVQGSSTDTSLVLGVIVPHGVPLGKRTLKVSTNGGLVTVPDVVEVTAITVAPTGSDDATHVGSVALPFRSVKQAVAVADVGDTIHLVDGTYSALPAASGGSGETWTGYMLPTDLTIIGDSAAGTILDGVGVNSVDGFTVEKNLTLKNLTIQDFRYGVHVPKEMSTLTMTDVVLTANSSNGVYVEAAAMGSTVTIAGTKGAITQPGQPAVYISNAPNVTVNITDATLQAGGNVVYFYYNPSGAKLNVTNATIKALTTNDAINFYSANNNTATGSTITLTNATIVGTVTDTDTKGTLTIMGGTITQKSGDAVDTSALTTSITGTMIMMTVANSGSGVYITSGVGSTVLLKDVTISGGSRGVYQNGNGSSAKLRGTTIQNTAADAYYLTQGNLDLGTAAEAGNNSLLTPVNNGYYCLNIYRSSGTATPITASGTAIGAVGAVPNMQTIDATATAISTPPKWYLYTGNKLVFN